MPRGAAAPEKKSTKPTFNSAGAPLGLAAALVRADARKTTTAIENRLSDQDILGINHLLIGDPLSARLPSHAERDFPDVHCRISPAHPERFAEKYSL
jgi:hypothetical protein